MNEADLKAQEKALESHRFSTLSVFGRSSTIAEDAALKDGFECACTYKNTQHKKEMDEAVGIVNNLYENRLEPDKLFIILDRKETKAFLAAHQKESK